MKWVEVGIETGDVVGDAAGQKPVTLAISKFTPANALSKNQ